MERSLSATPQPLHKRNIKKEKANYDPSNHTKRPLLVSPYFSQNRQESPTHVKPLVLSPYFCSQASQLHTLENVHVLPPGYFLHNNDTKLPQPKTAFHFQSPNTCGRERKGKRNREKKKVSPYFQNINKEVSTSPSTSVRETEGDRDINGSRNNFNKFLEAYWRKSGDNMWIPPKSVHGLLQEKYYEDPWKVLIICMLLNRTRGCQATNVIANLFELCPNGKAATEAETDKIENIITTLGLQKKRSMMIQQFSQDYLSDQWTHVTQLHGIGKYAADAYAIFCTGRWKDVIPDDHKLVPYWEDLWISEKIRLPVT